MFPENVQHGVDRVIPIRESLTGVGGPVRAHRMAKGLSLRQFARDLGVSASFISQLENGKSQPSVATLFAICDSLDMTVDQLFAEAAVLTGQPAQPSGMAHVTGAGAPPNVGLQAPNRGTSATEVVEDPVVRATNRRRLVLDTGVTWEQLASSQDVAGEFLLISYAVGGSSTSGGQMSRHNGTDYGVILSGELTLSLGFETYTLGPTDSISFDSSIPHRLDNRGTEPVQAVWFVLGDTSAFAQHRKDGSF